MSLRIKIKTRKLPIVGNKVRCHTLLHMNHNPNDIRAIPGKEYVIVEAYKGGYFRIKDEVGNDHGFDPTTYSRWFEFI